MPKIDGFQSFKTARRTIAGLEAMLWLRKSFGFFGEWTVHDQNDLSGASSDFKKLTKREVPTVDGIIAAFKDLCDKPPKTSSLPASPL